MDRLYYTYLIIKESLDYIPAIEIKGQLEEKYRIKVDVKTVDVYPRYRYEDIDVLDLSKRNH